MKAFIKPKQKLKIIYQNFKNLIKIIFNNKKIKYIFIRN